MSFNKFWLIASAVLLLSPARGLFAQVQTNAYQPTGTLYGGTNITISPIAGTPHYTISSSGGGPSLPVSAANGGTGDTQGRVPHYELIPNNTTGTDLNRLAKYFPYGYANVNSSGEVPGVEKLATTDTAAIGLVVLESSCSGGTGCTSGNAQVLYDGGAIAGSPAPSCIFDGAITQGDYFGISNTTAGDCTDLGSTYPTTAGTWVGGTISNATNGSAGTYTVVFNNIHKARNGFQAGKLIEASTTSCALTTAGSSPTMTTVASYPFQSWAVDPGSGATIYGTLGSTILVKTGTVPPNNFCYQLQMGTGCPAAVSDVHCIDGERMDGTEETFGPFSIVNALSETHTQDTLKPGSTCTINFMCATYGPTGSAVSVLSNSNDNATSCTACNTGSAVNGFAESAQ